MNGHFVERQEIDDDGQLHFYNENGNEVFPRIHPWRWRAISVWIALFTAAVIIVIGKQYQLTQANKDRVTDIQTSRLTSCLDTYNGVKKVFTPFFRPRSQETPQERRNRDKFDRTIRNLKRQCKSQITTGGKSNAKR